MYYYQPAAYGAFRLTDNHAMIRTDEPYVQFASYDALHPWMQERVTVLDLMPEGRPLLSVGVRLFNFYYLLFSLAGEITCITCNEQPQDTPNTCKKPIQSNAA